MKKSRNRLLSVPRRQLLFTEAIWSCLAELRRALHNFQVFRNSIKKRRKKKQKEKKGRRKVNRRIAYPANFSAWLIRYVPMPFSILSSFPRTKLTGSLPFYRVRWISRWNTAGETEARALAGRETLLFANVSQNARFLLHSVTVSRPLIRSRGFSYSYGSTDPVNLSLGKMLRSCLIERRR